MFELTKQNFANWRQHAPQTPGLCRLYSGNKLVFVTKTGNIASRVANLMTRLNTEETITPNWLEQIDTITWEESPSLWQALLAEKALLSQVQPEQQEDFHFTSHYSYLAVDFNAPPWLQQRPDTNDSRFYIGPFRESFFVNDLIDTLSYLSGSPVLLSSPDPDTELLHKQIESSTVIDKQTFADFIHNCLLNPNGPCLTNLHSKMETAGQELDFELLEALRPYHRVLERYYLQLRFFIASRYLNLSWEENSTLFTVQSGMLAGASDVDARPNEQLALPKANLDEAWIIYTHLQELNPGLIDKAVATCLQNLNIK